MRTTWDRAGKSWMSTRLVLGEAVSLAQNGANKQYHAFRIWSSPDITHVHCCTFPDSSVESNFANVDHCLNHLPESVL